jgi:hypothetical protein
MLYCLSNKMLNAKYVLEGGLTQTPGILHRVSKRCSYIYKYSSIPLADKTETAQQHVEDKQRVYCDAHAIPDHTTSAHN